MISLHLPG